MSDRETLAMPSLDDLGDFAPRGVESGAGQGPRNPEAALGPRPADPRRAIDAVSQFPSREASLDGQLNLKGPRHILDRFKAMCKADRRVYYDMLEILMDRFEGKTRD